MTDIFIGVDGTGPSDDAEYEQQFGRTSVEMCQDRQSHVYTLWQRWHGTEKTYTRGPTTLGLTTQNLAATAARSAHSLYRSNSDARLFLAGYSRGGAAVIQAAALLQVARVPVHCLMLFDAVDRAALILMADTIPGNVRHCFHAMRRFTANSRSYFGNCGTRAAGGVQFHTERFRGTHGAMGGLPWPEESVGSRGTVNEHGGFVDSAANAVRRGLGGAVNIGLRAATGSQGLGDMAGRLAGRAGEHLTRRALYTNITPAEDETASAAVWDWMSGHLANARAG